MAKGPQISIPVLKDIHGDRADVVYIQAMRDDRDRLARRGYVPLVKFHPSHWNIILKNRRRHPMEPRTRKVDVIYEFAPTGKRFYSRMSAVEWAIASWSSKGTYWTYVKEDPYWAKN